VRLAVQRSFDNSIEIDRKACGSSSHTTARMVRTAAVHDAFETAVLFQKGEQPSRSK
jgi:hypothetical protein